MSIPPPALQLRRSTSLLHTIARLQHEGNPIPSKWLDVPNDELLSPLALSKTHGGIERAVEQALYDHHKASKQNSFPLQKVLQNTPNKVFTFEDADVDAVTVKELYQQLSTKLQYSSLGVTLSFTPEQFAMLRPSMLHLMYFYDKQALTGASIFLGNVANVMFFQWGRMLGIIKYFKMPGEQAIKDNSLVYFEDAKNRTIEQFVMEYQNKHHGIQQIIAPTLILPELIVNPPVITTPEPAVSVPTLSLRLTPPWPVSK